MLQRPRHWLAEQYRVHLGCSEALEMRLTTAPRIVGGAMPVSLRILHIQLLGFE